MLYRIAADITVLLHLIWILFLIFGAFIGRKYRWVKRVHISAIIFALVIQFFGWYCPFTHLEIWLRKIQDSSKSYSGSFIIHYVEKIVYINLSPKIITALTIILVVISALLYIPRQKKL
jgi:cytochrome c biogenesis protein CcdA